MKFSSKNKFKENRLTEISYSSCSNLCSIGSKGKVMNKTKHFVLKGTAMVERSRALVAVREFSGLNPACSTSFVVKIAEKYGKK